MERVIANGTQSRNELRLRGLDLFCMLLGLFFSVLICYVFSHGRIFWEDELLGWMLLRDPSWHHMVSAWNMGADGGGFAFYLLGRIWFALLGPSELSLRLYSAAALGLAFVVVWATLRHFYRLPVVFFALFNTWFFSTYIVVHMAEGRYYGLLVLSTALLTWITMVPARRPSGTVPWLYPLTFFVSLLLSTSHQLGVVFSAFLLGSMAALDWMEGRFRPGLYASGAVAWCALLLEREAIAGTARVGKPHFWTTRPSLSNFVGAYTGFSAEVATALLVLLVLLAATLWLRSRSAPGAAREVLAHAFRDRRPVWVVVVAFLLIPLAYLVEGKLGTWLFVNRYLLPVTIGQVLLTAEAIELIDWSRIVPRPVRSSRWALPVAAVCFSAVMVVWVFGRLKRFVIPPENYADTLTAMLPKGVPVVCEDAWTFSELVAREHNSGVNYVYLLDWPYAMDPKAPLLEVTQFHLMENWRKVGYFAGSIQYRDEFLRSHPSFLVLRIQPDPRPPGPLTSGNPLIDRFEQTAGYQVLPYGDLHRFFLRDVIALVCRGSCQNAVVTPPAQPIERYMPALQK